MTKVSFRWGWCCGTGMAFEAPPHRKCLQQSRRGQAPPRDLSLTTRSAGILTSRDRPVCFFWLVCNFFVWNCCINLLHYGPRLWQQTWEWRCCLWPEWGNWSTGAAAAIGVGDDRPRQGPLLYAKSSWKVGCFRSSLLSSRGRESQWLLGQMLRVSGSFVFMVFVDWDLLFRVADFLFEPTHYFSCDDGAITQLARLGQCKWLTEAEFCLVVYRKT